MPNGPVFRTDRIFDDECSDDEIDRAIEHKSVKELENEHDQLEAEETKAAREEFFASLKAPPNLFCSNQTDPVTQQPLNQLIPTIW
jgi:hypothetical protein